MIKVFKRIYFELQWLKVGFGLAFFLSCLGTPKKEANEIMKSAYKRFIENKLKKP